MIIFYYKKRPTFIVEKILLNFKSNEVNGWFHFSKNYCNILYKWTTDVKFL